MGPQVTLLIPNRSEPQLEHTIIRLQTIIPPELATILVEPDPRSSGIGATLRRGLQRVDTPWVIFVMADGSEDPLCLYHMIKLIETTHPSAVWGNRWDPAGSVLDYPRGKRIANRLGNWGISLLLGDWSYRDWTDVAKAYRTRLLRQLAWSDDFRCAVEIPLRYRAQDSVWDLRVVPMWWRERSVGTSAYSPWQALKVLWSALQETLQ